MRFESIQLASVLRRRASYYRRLSNVTLDATQGDVEDVLERNIVSLPLSHVHARQFQSIIRRTLKSFFVEQDKTGKTTDQEQPVLLTTSREALHL